ncbi:TRAF-type zinc finger domain-containing protein 1-like isoform X2 [Ischnura elegans]|uniref:TRAF-type zinc finger domain-containing protein 1-like isoform X2 n=1 Tax=Ischnura elegans TaxID=197161 RepID=UPI001ED87AEE|nr:TRAF-type zinc finger domain-containing protein 1-like isoform X2 [Ischnura elegans]
MAEENNFCANCKRDIPSVNFVMHSIHCARNITLCTLCEEPVPRSEMDSHQAEFHSLKDCEACGERFDVAQLREHKANTCPMRRVNCSICELELPATEIIEHENYCGSRTELCEDCGEYVMLKYNKLHLESNHGFLKLDDEPGPSPSWQSNERVVAPVIGGYENGASWRPPVQNNVTLGATRVPSASTSKRNNDMPQLNSILPPQAVKSLHKPLIMGDKSSRSYSVGEIDSDVAALFGDSLHLGRRLPSGGHSGGEEDLVALPCEFCEALVPANQLIIHQTACRPDLARYDIPAAAVATSVFNAHSPGPAMLSRVNAPTIHNNLTSSPPPSPLHLPARRDHDDLDDTLLPCEFCHKSFSINKLYEHQTQCTWSLTDGFNGRQDTTFNGRPDTTFNGRPDTTFNGRPDTTFNRRPDTTFNGRPDTTFNGRPDPVDQLPSTSMPKFVAEYKSNDKNVEREAYKEDVKKPASRLPNELKPRRRGGREFVGREWTLPPGAPKVRPSAALASSQPVVSNVNDFESDGGRQALLKQAQMMEKINAQLGLKKESSNSQMNHVYSDLPTWVPRAPKQPNYFNNSPSSSRNLGSYTSPSGGHAATAGRGRGGGRTTGAIPKQKAGTSKSPITY